ncbi:uncharacterized protein si:dkeyp-110g5.4 isoform X2 [Danio aesculapii]|uniref:uncharacterized protein si:dkeyp-110g5.4 isoform X2 n=1 Tax=Danio aesculapii TaxID=1142201 RepID=UPI0024BFB892|nr:uncharacterized protein si:dkeyp-110g5.4 isoform X2 [Danio aesculapii]
MENTVVYIPKEACVKNIPLQSLSSSLSRKISVALFQHKSRKQTVTWICPVELRQKEASLGKGSSRLRPLLTQITPGQFLLPVVSSSITAYKVLRTDLKTNKPEVQFSGQEETEVTSLTSIRNSVQRNAIIVCNGQIFLSVRKTRCRRVTLQSCPSAPEGVGSASSGQHQQINNTDSCQAQLLRDTSDSPQQNQVQDVQPPDQELDPNTENSPLVQKISEEMPEQCCTEEECQKVQDVQPPDQEIDPNTENSPLVQKISKEMPEQCCTEEECQKVQDVQPPDQELDLNTENSPLVQKISEEECQKEAELTSESRSRSNTPLEAPLDLESSHEASSMEVTDCQPQILQQILQTSSGISQQPEAAGGDGKTDQDDSERLEAVELPRAESCLTFDFQQLAHEERINHLRARLRQKEAALSIFNLKPTDQI